MIPTSIDGTDITGATIDGTEVSEITVDGQTVFTAGLPPALFVGGDKLYALDQSNGDVLWSNNPGGSVDGGVANDEDTVYAG